jgi:cyanate lyase
MPEKRKYTVYKARRRISMTKNEIAKKLKLSPSYVTMLFKGQRKLTDALLHKVHKYGLENEFKNLNGVQVVGGSNPPIPTNK